jgi:hypothetical protein
MSLSRQVLLILVILATAVVFACATADRHAKRAAVSAVVSVKVVGDCAVASPDPVYVPARAGRNGDQPVPNAINWFGPRDQTLKVEMKEPDQQCVRDIYCVRDHCTAVTNVDFHGGTSAQCKYKVWIDGVTKACDPVIVIDNCCDNLY